MTFYDMLEQVIGLLQRHGRVTYPWLASRAENRVHAPHYPGICMARRATV